MLPVYFITFTTRGTRIHGNEAGSVDRFHNTPGTPYLNADMERESAILDSMVSPPFVMGAVERKVVLDSIVETAGHRGWSLLAAHVRSTHAHVIVKADDQPEKVARDMKAWATRKIRENAPNNREIKPWTRHSSTRWINFEEQLQAAIRYVLEEQGAPMERFDGSKDRS